MRRVTYGPPGTGKTSHIREAVQTALRGGLVSPEKTYLLSFSKAGAAELAGRIENSDTINIGTIHSLCYRLAGLHRGRVIDNRKMVDFGTYSGIEIKLDRIQEDGSTEELTEGEVAYAIYSLARARCENPETVYNAQKNPPKNAVWFRYFCDSFEKWKATYGYVDFNDMLVMGEQLVCDPSYRLEIDLLVVDEAQDLSEQQWRVVRGLAPRAANLIVAGDDDQAIFAWAGADPAGMAKFFKRYADERVVLEKSWRLPEVVKEAAERLIERVADREPKPFVAAGHAGAIRTADSVLHSLDERDTLILYRNHSIRQEFEPDLIEAGIPYVNHNGRPSPLRSPLAGLIRELEKVPDLSFIDRSIAWGLDKWFHPGAIRKYQDGKLSLIDFVATANYKGEILWYLINTMKKVGHLSDFRPNVRLSTIHGAKGREAAHVILINSTTANSLEAWENDRENELRVWYVGMTRAKTDLTIIEYDNPVELL